MESTQTTMTSSTSEIEEGTNKVDLYQEQSERKRCREKKRRQDISAAIERLTATLVKIDPQNLVSHNKQVYFGEDSIIPNSKRRFNGGSLLSNQQNQPLNRTEIINHTIHVVDRLAREREEMNLKIFQLQHHLNASKQVAIMNSASPAASSQQGGRGSATGPAVINLVNSDASGQPQAAPTYAAMQHQLVHAW